MKYRKKPVIIEAYRTNEEKVIHTLEGDMKAFAGDYVITGVKGGTVPLQTGYFQKDIRRSKNDWHDFRRSYPSSKEW